MVEAPDKIREVPVRATVPSNIALIKYWGKRNGSRNWPANDSLSMTLTEARTITDVWVRDQPFDAIVWEGAPALRSDDPRAASDKAMQHLRRLRDLLGFDRSLHVETRNTFPSDCGIASSASGLAALTVGAIAAWTGSSEPAQLAEHGFDKERLAALARLGSGSACRSLHGGYVHWQAGVTPEAQSLSVVASPEHFPLANVIVILSKSAKAISSTAAHRDAWTSPLFPVRLAGVDRRLAGVKRALEQKDLETLGDLIETEALEMHAVMMSSKPSACYFTEGTSQLLAWVRRERQKGQLEAWFTVDAGPNVHLITRPEYASQVARQVREAFGDVELIIDHTGRGMDLSRGGPQHHGCE